MTNLNEITYVDWQLKLNSIGEVAEGVDDINQCIAIILLTKKVQFRIVRHSAQISTNILITLSMKQPQI